MLTEPKTNETKRKIRVVKELPVQEVRIIKNMETGEEFDVITTEEALTLLLNSK